MSDYCYRKSVRMRITEDEACKILNCEDGWAIADLLENTKFEIAPTSEFFIDYNLSCNKEATGDWGRSRPLRYSELQRYRPLFSKLLNGRGIGVNELALVEYCWYDCSEAPDYFDETTVHDDFYDEV